MNSTSFFSLRRFGLLMRNDILLNYKKYIYSIIGALILGYVILYSEMPKNINYYDVFNDTKYAGIFIACLIGLAVFLGLSFPALETKAGSASYLLLPASTFEKFLSQFFIRVIIGTALFFVVFWIDAQLARLTALSVLKHIGGSADVKVFEFADVFTFIRNKPIILSGALISFFVSMGIFIFSVRLFFNKLAVVKIAITMAAMFGVIVLLVVLFSHIFYPGDYGFEVKLPHYNRYLNFSNFDVWVFSMFYFPWLFFLPLGYFKLKEKQV